MPSAISQQVLGLATSTSPGLAQAGGYNILPAGIVFPFAGGTAPTGFLLCEGQQISKTTYSALYAAIGDDYATQINPTTGLAWAAPDADKFRVPDYRGIFLRGVGTPSGLDAVTRGAQQADKTKKNGLNATSNQVTASLNAAPSFTGSAVTSLGESVQHSHSINSYKNASDTGQHLIAATGSTVNFSSSAGTNNNNQGHTHSVTAAGSNSAPAITASTPTITVGAGDNETRPINKGVAYIIKA